MSERESLGRVGVRELRQNLSVYLERVKDGESLDVTERGIAVARLSPLPSPSDPLARLIAEGRIRPATVSLADLPPRVKLPPGAQPVSETLIELRDEDDR